MHIALLVIPLIFFFLCILSHLAIWTSSHLYLFMFPLHKAALCRHSLRSRHSDANARFKGLHPKERNWLQLASI